METQAVAGRLLLNGPRIRRRRSVAENVVAETPFIRVTPNGQQVSLNRDTLAQLGRPDSILWFVHGSGTDQVFRLISASKTAPGSFTVSYSRRLSATSTVPKQFRAVIKPKRYWATSLSKAGESPRWVEYSISRNTPTGMPVAGEGGLK
jgi:hypothetical protein